MRGYRGIVKENGRIEKKDLHLLMKYVWRGRKIIKQIIKENNINLEMDFLIILPEHNLELNFYMLYYLNLLVKQFEMEKDILEERGIPVIRENEKFIVITSDNRLKEDGKNIFPRLTRQIILTSSEMDMILARYAFYPMNARIILGAIERVNGRNYQNLLKKRNISLKEIVAVSILGIKRQHYIRGAKWKLSDETMANREIKNLVRQLNDTKERKI